MKSKNKSLVKWRSFFVCGREYLISDGARALTHFPPAEGKVLINTIILTPAQFGEDEMLTARLLDAPFLVQWSKKNSARLPKGCSVGLLRAEVVPDICAQYADQPRGERLWVGMKPVPNPKSSLAILCIHRCHEDGLRRLETGVVDPEDVSAPDDKFIFELY